MNKQKKLIKDIEYAENKFFEVEVYYDKGGINYFSGGTIQRGYFLAVRPVEKTLNTFSDGTKYTSRSFMMFSGTKKFLESANRFSAKTLEKICSNISSVEINELVNHVAKAENIVIPTTV